jgi:hypothetical protein
MGGTLKEGVDGLSKEIVQIKGTVVALHRGGEESLEVAKEERISNIARFELLFLFPSNLLLFYVPIAKKKISQ